MDFYIEASLRIMHNTLTQMKKNLIPAPPTPTQSAGSNQVRHGRAYPPVDQLKLMSPADWESLIHEWSFCLKEIKGYKNVYKIGAALDEGRDIFGCTEDSDSEGPWDNYQCKHYDHPLYPTEIWLEMGKLCWYTFIKAYSIPRVYYFVAPHGAGTTLTKLLNRPAQINSHLIKNWERYCEQDITSTQAIKLQGLLLQYVEQFDFSIVKQLQPLALLEEYSTTRYYSFRFGGGLPPRPKVEKPPGHVEEGELRYTTQLLEAYSDKLGTEIADKDSLTDDGLKKHFQRSREHFYCAEALKGFSRDTLPEGAFDELQDSIYHGVIDTVEQSHSNGFERIVETTRTSNTIDVKYHALESVLKPEDRFGVCHQLANENKIQWVKK